MKKIVMCGADVHDNSVTARVAVNKEKPETRVFRYTRQGRQNMFKYLKLVARKYGADRIVVAYEASSLGFGLCDECTDAGIECYVLAPTKMPQSEEQRKRKTDKRDAQKILEQLTGVAVLTAMVFLTEMGDLRRFKNRKKVGAFMGVVPSSNETGENSDRKGHITRQGPARLRKVLCQGAWSRVTFDPEESKVHARIVEKNPKKKKIATVACMRRLGVRMWHIALQAQIEAGVYKNKDLQEAKRIAA